MPWTRPSKMMRLAVTLVRSTTLAQRAGAGLGGAIVTERVGFEGGGFHAEDLLHGFAGQQVVNDRRAALALGIVDITNPLHRHFLAGILIVAGDARVEHPLLD